MYMYVYIHHAHIRTNKQSCIYAWQDSRWPDIRLEGLYAVMCSGYMWAEAGVILSPCHVCVHTDRSKALIHIASF